MTTLVRAEGDVLEHILDMTYSGQHQGLSRKAFRAMEAAHRRIAWAQLHQSRLALMKGSEVLASAQQYVLAGTLSGERLTLCGIASLWAGPESDERAAQQLVERMVAQATRAGDDAAIFYGLKGEQAFVPDGFELIPLEEVVLDVAEPLRYGAPMTLVRAGEDRDLAAIAAMGRVRAEPYRFHLDRDIGLIQFAITKHRLLAGLGAAGARQLHFMIAEEGITAAAYVVISSVGNAWTIEECGDRDPSGARVGALLQALIAREPAECRPVIRGWLPPGFIPPQVTMASVAAPQQAVWWRLLGKVRTPTLPPTEVLYWLSDVF